MPRKAKKPLPRKKRRRDSFSSSSDSSLSSEETSYLFNYSAKTQAKLDQGTPEPSDLSECEKEYETLPHVDADEVSWDGPNDLCALQGYPAVRLELDNPDKPQLKIDISALVQDHLQRNEDAKRNRIEGQGKGKITSKGFLRLPPEIRNRIYRMVLRSNEQINFTRQTRFERSAALLRSNRTVYEEGREILYGENSFLFVRMWHPRGSFWQEWTEVGYKDVRRFLETIGPHNVAKLRYVAFTFEDATRTATPNATHEQRRFINDRHLYRVFALLGAEAVLNRLVIYFNGRAMVTRSDAHFLHALAKLRTRQLHFATTTYHYSSKVRQDVLNKLKEVMLVDADIKEEDEAKNGVIQGNTNTNNNNNKLEPPMPYQDSNYVRVDVA